MFGLFGGTGGKFGLGLFGLFGGTCNKKRSDQDSVAGSVIQASGMVLFEDGLKPGTLVVDIWSAASVRTTPVVNLAPHVRSHPDMGVQCGVEVA